MPRKSVIYILLGQEIGLIIVSFIWLMLKNISSINKSGFISIFSLEPFKRFDISFQSLLYGVSASLILIFLSFVITFTYEPFKKSLQLLDDLILHVIKPIDILPIAILSGIGEELFFRGVLQDSLGLLPSNIIFALLHFPGRQFWVYSLWTLFAGLFLGNIYAYTHNLFIVIIAHIMNNLLALILWNKFKTKILKDDAKL